MTPKQRSLLSGIYERAVNLHQACRILTRRLDELTDSLADERPSRSDFTSEEIDRLLSLNRRLRVLQDYLLKKGREQDALLQPRIADPNDPLDDYEIEVTLYYTLREDDPDFDEHDDNCLTQREFPFKGAGSEAEHCLSDLSDWREPGVLGDLVQEPHCYLFHDLYDHTYGLDKPALAPVDCLRVGSIWVNVAVWHQSTLDIDSGEWLPPVPRRKINHEIEAPQ